MSKILLLNGPRECGKNIAVDHIKKLYDLKDRRCKDKLFKLVQEMFCVSEARFWEIYNNRELKERPLTDFKLSRHAVAALYDVVKDEKLLVTYETNAVSIRNAMIYVSECICKPAFGNDYFGVARASSISDCELAIDDSCGFDEEIAPTLEKLGPDNVMLVRINGRGTFENDSRAFISDNVVPNTVDIFNEGDEDKYLDSIMDLATEFYGRPPIELMHDDGRGSSILNSDPLIRGDDE